MPDSKQAKKPREMSPEAQKTYDATISFLTAVTLLALLALLLTLSFNLATPITRLSPVSPFAVFGVLGFIEGAVWEVKRVWRYFKG